MIHLEDEVPEVEDRIWRLEILQAFPVLSDISIKYYRQRPPKDREIMFIYLYFKPTWWGRNFKLVKMPCKRSVELFLESDYV